MATFSTLRAKSFNERFSQFAKAYPTHRPLVQRFLNISFVVYVLTTTYRGLASRPASSSSSGGKGKGKVNADQKQDGTGKPPRVAVDALFYQRLSSILRIVIPSIRSKEALLLAMHSSLLIFRTAISLYVAALDGKCVPTTPVYTPRVLIKQHPGLLLVSYVQNKLAIAYRTRLTKEIMKQYLGEEAEGPEGKVYYKISIYSNMAKPVLDVILYNYQLSQNVGAEGLLILTILVQSSAVLLRRLTPPFGMYTALSAQLSGSLRHTHSRIAEFAEEIAFLNGEQTEKTLLEREYASVLQHEHHVLSRRWWFGCVEEGVIKWLWGAYGGEPADAFGRVMYSYKDLSELAGYTARVSLLLDTMKDVRKGKFEKALVSSATIGENANILRGHGQVIESDDIQFENVPIVTPNGDVLVRSLSFQVKPGQHLLIVGPNGEADIQAYFSPISPPLGCGKSSLFRILGGLWPVYGGVVRKPPASDFILIPQRPYLSLGNLRDQITYPHSKAEMEARGITDNDLLQILAVVGMESIVEREGGWDITREWRDALSGGDKQKIAWARLFYHNPRYAILDEATSLVPTDMEGLMMEHATRLGITLLTVSHRPSLWKYHALILHYDGQGGYVFTKLDAEKRLALQEEKQNLENKLLEVPKMKARLAELKAVAQP
ncbi:hypothetical protein DXG01_004253 [Tephrocybe rancida]|nr:hypothetical protein DXG01_004253 [Tephrocybe rancida]